MDNSDWSQKHFGIVVRCIKLCLKSTLDITPLHNLFNNALPLELYSCFAKLMDVSVDDDVANCNANHNGGFGTKCWFLLHLKKSI